MADGKQPQTTETPHTEVIAHRETSPNILDRLRPPDGAGQGALSQEQMDQNSKRIEDIVSKMRKDDAKRQQQQREDDAKRQQQQLENYRKLMDRNLNVGRALSNLGVEDSSVFFDALKGDVDAQARAQEVLNDLKNDRTNKNNLELDSLERKLEAAKIKGLARLENDRLKQLNRSLKNLPLHSTDAGIIGQALSGDSAATPRAREILASFGENPTAISLSQELSRPQSNLESSLPSSVSYDVGPILAPTKGKALEALENAMNQAGAQPPQVMFEIRKLLRFDPGSTAFDRQDFAHRVASLNPSLLDPNLRDIKVYLDKVLETYPLPKPTPEVSAPTGKDSASTESSEQANEPAAPESDLSSDRPQSEDEKDELVMATKIQGLLSPYLHDAQSIIDSIPNHLDSLGITTKQISILMEIIQEMKESLNDLSNADIAEPDEKAEDTSPVLSEDGDNDDIDFDENPFSDESDETEESDVDSEDLLSPNDTEQIMGKAIEQVRELINHGANTADGLAAKAMDIMRAVKNGLPEDLKKKIKGPIKTAIFSVLVMCAISLVLASTVTGQSS